MPGMIGSGWASVVFRLQLGLRALPQRARRVDLLGFVALDELYGEQDVVRVGRDDMADVIRLEIFLRLVLQMQHDLRAALDPRGFRLVGGPDVEAGAARGAPHESIG